MTQQMTSPGEPVQTDLFIEEELWLDLGCGPNPFTMKDPAGNVIRQYLGVDAINFGKNMVHDLRRQWPWKDESVSGVYCSHFFEHLENPERIFFMNELWRVLKWDAEALLITPHWSSDRAYGDPTHKWPPISDMTHFYWLKSWRDVNAPHVPFTCDFESTMGYAFNNHQDLVGRNQEFLMNGAVFKRNVVADVLFTLKKKKH